MQEQQTSKQEKCNEQVNNQVLAAVSTVVKPVVRDYLKDELDTLNDFCGGFGGLGINIFYNPEKSSVRMQVGLNGEHQVFDQLENQGIVITEEIFSKTLKEAFELEDIKIQVQDVKKDGNETCYVCCCNVYR